MSLHLEHHESPSEPHTAIEGVVDRSSRYAAANLPATGIWTLRPTSIVGLTSRFIRSQLKVTSGYLSIADRPDRSTLTILASSDDRPLQLSASTVSIDVDADGLSRWRMRGTLYNGTSLDPVDLDLAYLGIHECPSGLWVSFMGRASVHAVRRNVRLIGHELTIELDMRFDPPTF